MSVISRRTAQDTETFPWLCYLPHHHPQKSVHLPKWTRHPHWTLTPLPTWPQPPAPSLLPVSMDETPPGTFSGGSQTASVLLCLDYFSEHHVLKGHPRCSVCQDFLPFKSHPMRGPQFADPSFADGWTCLHLSAAATVGPAPSSLEDLLRVGRPGSTVRAP